MPCLLLLPCSTSTYIIILTHNHTMRTHVLMWTSDAVNNISAANRDYIEFKGTRFIDIKDIYSHSCARTLVSWSKRWTHDFIESCHVTADQSVDGNKLCYNEAFCYLTRYYFINDISTLLLILHGNQRYKRIKLAQLIYTY